MSTPKTITWLELMKHSNKHDAWLLIDGKVFDVTSYLAEHPGGDDILLKNAGKDGTQQFRDVNNHTGYAISLRDQRLVGEIEKNDPPAEYVDWLKKNVKESNKLTWNEVKKHNKESDCWIVVDGKVFDVTTYLNKHPGGPVLLKKQAGRDASLHYKAANHPTYVLQERETYQVGVVSGPDPNPQSKTAISDKQASLFSPLNLVLALLVAALGYYFFVQTNRS